MLKQVQHDDDGESPVLQTSPSLKPPPMTKIIKPFFVRVRVRTRACARMCCQLCQLPPLEMQRSRAQLARTGD
jgi:hypothetical protein